MKKCFSLVLIIVGFSVLSSCKKKSHQIDKDPSFSISGLIDGNNLNFSNVVISIGSTEVNSSNTGSYTLPNLKSGSYKLIPQLSGYKFKPESIDVMIDGKNVTGVNFSVVLNTDIAVTSSL